MFVENFRGIFLDEDNDLKLIFYNVNYNNPLQIEGFAKSDKYSVSMNITPRKRKVEQNIQKQLNILNQAQLPSVSDENSYNELLTSFEIKEEHKPKKV